VKETDVLIIAISSCALGQHGNLMDFPISAIDKVTKNAGNLWVNLETGEQNINQRNGITKLSGSVVKTNSFDDPYYSIISGIIYSNEDPLNAQNSPEKSFVFSKNVNANNSCSFVFS
jgi:hypothetical protein